MHELGHPGQMRAATNSLARAPPAPRAGRCRHSSRAARHRCDPAPPAALRRLMRCAPTASALPPERAQFLAPPRAFPYPPRPPGPFPLSTGVQILACFDDFPSLTLE